MICRDVGARRLSDVFTRRRFLQSVGAGGGAGAMFATMGALGLAPTGPATAAPFRPPRPSDFTLTGCSAATVVVLGGGVAGSRRDPPAVERRGDLSAGRP